MLRKLKSLFAKPREPELPDPGDMPIEAVWEEFVSTVRYPDGSLVIDELRKPDFAKALAWLRPPTDCPLAKALMRAMVGAQRGGQIAQVDNFATVYKADEESTDRRPPDTSLEAIGQMCSLLRVSGTVFYQTNPDDENSYMKIEITLED